MRIFTEPPRLVGYSLLPASTHLTEALDKLTDVYKSIPGMTSRVLGKLVADHEAFEECLLNPQVNDAERWMTGLIFRTERESRLALLFDPESGPVMISAYAYRDPDHKVVIEVIDVLRIGLQTLLEWYKMAPERHGERRNRSSRVT